MSYSAGESYAVHGGANNVRYGHMVRGCGRAAAHLSARGKRESYNHYLQNFTCSQEIKFIVKFYLFPACFVNFYMFLAEEFPETVEAKS